MTDKLNRLIFTGAFAVGALAIIWVGAGFIGTSVLALLMTAIIGAAFGFGALELVRFRRASATLGQALAALPDKLTDLGDWLATIDPSLRQSVRLRIEGERAALPGPALTPYLVGLLVMLGMLGTFLGMVVTLKGAVFALEKTTDLEAIRAALAVPVKGLGLAFGTSVAGVGASAMLGLMSALSRRDRAESVHLLDGKVATVLRDFSLVHQRQETFKALQAQSQALPLVAEQLQTLMVRLEEMSRQANQRLLSNQESFHDNIKGVYTELARAVDHSLRDSLKLGAQAAGDSIKPVVETAMGDIARQANALHERVAASVQTQLDGLSARFADTAAQVADSWRAALLNQEQANAGVTADLNRSLQSFNASFDQRADTLTNRLGQAYLDLQAEDAERDRQRQEIWLQSLQAMATRLTQELQQGNAQTLERQQQICDTLTRTAHDITEQAQTSARHAQSESARLIALAEELMRSRIAAEAQWIEQQRERMDRLTEQLRSELGKLRDEEAARGNAAVERLSELQAALAAHLTTLGTALEAPIARLIETASEAPRAAAEVIGQMREEISRSVARDNALLDERSRIMATLNALLEAINHASLEQRAIIDALVASSEKALNATANAFSDNVAAEAAKLADIAAEVTGSAVDVASLSDAFGAAVQSFNDANDKLIVNLERIEAALDKSQSRSDEQLAYYVAQARDIIDLSIGAQKEIVDELRQLKAAQPLLADEVR